MLGEALLSSTNIQQRAVRLPMLEMTADECFCGCAGLHL